MMKDYEREALLNISEFNPLDDPDFVDELNAAIRRHEERKHREDKFQSAVDQEQMFIANAWGHPTVKANNAYLVTNPFITKKALFHGILAETFNCLDENRDPNWRQLLHMTQRLVSMVECEFEMLPMSQAWAIEKSKRRLFRAVEMLAENEQIYDISIDLLDQLYSIEAACINRLEHDLWVTAPAKK